MKDYRMTLTRMSLLILVITLLSSAVILACGTEPQRPDESMAGETAASTSGLTPGVSGTGGQDGGDPVLLDSGEFLLKRTDSVASNNVLIDSFPIVRTYRSKPAPVTLQNGIDETGAEIGSCPGGDSVAHYSDPCVFRWIVPSGDDPEDPYDQYYDFDVEFNITPETGFISVPSGLEFFIMPKEGVDTWDSVAYCFELGTGTTYTASIVYTVRDPEWYWDNAWLVDFMHSPVEVYRWETTFTVPEFPQAEEPEQEDGNNVPTHQDSPMARGAHNNIPSPEWTPGWDMSYNMHLDVYPDFDPNNGIDDRKIYFYSGDGNIYTYTPSTQHDPIYWNCWRCEKRDDLISEYPNGSHALIMKEDKRIIFNPDGTLNSIHRGPTKLFEFHYSDNYGINNELKRLEYINDRLGRKTELFYEDSTSFYPGNLAKIRDWTGRVWSYDYYTDGNLKSVIDPEGNIETYSYDGDGRLEQVRDNDGNVWIDNDYDQYGRVYYQTMGTETFTFDYSVEDTVTVTDCQGAEVTHLLNDEGYSLSKEVETDVSSVTTGYTYDDNNRMTSVTYPEGNGYELNYDSMGNLIKLIRFSNDPNDPNLVYSAAYDTSSLSSCQMTSITDPRNNTTSFGYDYADRLNLITYPPVMTNQGMQTPQVGFTYGIRDEIKTVTSPDNIVVKYDYYPDPDLISSFDPNSYPGFDPNWIGQVKTVIVDYGQDPNCRNLTYNFTYGYTDANSFPTSDPNYLMDGLWTVNVEYPDATIASMSYDTLNLLRLVEDQDGYLTRLDYNADKKLTNIQRQYGSGWQQFEYGYNILAKLTTITDSLGKTTTLGYDSRYQVDSIEDANTNETTKDYNTRKLVKEIIDAENGSTTFDYDDNGHLSVITDAENKATHYAYDGYGRLETVTYADTSFEQYGYDDNSNLTLFINRAGETIIFDYDALNRLITKTRPNESDIELTYDIAGRLVDVSQATKQMAFDYDRLGRLEATTDQYGKTVGYEYDAMGRRTELTYPDNSHITYEYDNVGRLEYIKDGNDNTIVEYVYDELSRMTQVLYYRSGSSVGSMQYDYEDVNANNDDNLGSRIERIDYCCNPSHSISYTYDNVGNVTSMDVGGNYDWTYGYDNTYQVTYADQGAATNRMVDFDYDSVYNRTYWSDTLGSVSISYDDNALNQYTQNGWRTPTYDARGNMTSIGQWWTMTYDCENRMTSAISGTVQYEYDLLGRRNRRKLSTNYDARYVWDGAQIIAEYDNLTGSLTKKYIYGPGMDNPVAMINVSGTSESWYYYYTDALGSTRLMTDASGSIVESYTYDVYGRPYVMQTAGADNNWLTEDVTTSSSSNLGNPYLFTGRRWDSATLQYYYRFRDYDPVLGRFLQTDPAKYIDTMNLYAYCGNNPVNWIDPWGLCGEKNGGEDGPDFWDWSDFGKNVVVGAAGGAAAGAKFLKGKGALIGAGVGAIVGAVKYTVGQAWDAGEYCIQHPLKDGTLPINPDDYLPPPSPPYLPDDVYP